MNIDEILTASKRAAQELATNPDYAGLRQQMYEAEQQMVPAGLRAQGWIYRDMPSRFTPEFWDKFLGIMGEGNYKIVIMSSGDDWVRGQFFLSPQALENIRAYAASKDKLP